MSLDELNDLVKTEMDAPTHVEDEDILAQMLLAVKTESTRDFDISELSLSMASETSHSPTFQSSYPNFDALEMDMNSLGESFALEEEVKSNLELLRQHRMEAQIKAANMVRSRMGYVCASASEEENDDDETDMYRSTPPPPLPRKLKPQAIFEDGTHKRIINVPPPESFIEDKHQMEELVFGAVVRRREEIEDYEQRTRCENCELMLCVNKMALLVSCPECSSVSPSYSSDIR